jgi:hypothetical protein
MEIRTPAKTTAKLEEIANAPSLAAAIPLAIDLINNYYRKEGKVATKYDTKTGKPVEHRWKPYERFENALLVDGRTSNKIDISSATLDHLKKLPRAEALIFEVDNTPYAISYEVRREAIGGDQFGTDYGDQGYLVVKKLRASK